MLVYAFGPQINAFMPVGILSMLDVFISLNLQSGIFFWTGIIFGLYTGKEGIIAGYISLSSAALLQQLHITPL